MSPSCINSISVLLGSRSGWRGAGRGSGCAWASCLVPRGVRWGLEGHPSAPCVTLARLSPVFHGGRGCRCDVLSACACLCPGEDPPSWVLGVACPWGQRARSRRPTDCPVALQTAARFCPSQGTGPPGTSSFSFESSLSVGQGQGQGRDPGPILQERNEVGVPVLGELCWCEEGGGDAHGRGVHPMGFLCAQWAVRPREAEPRTQGSPAAGRQGGQMLLPPPSCASGSRLHTRESVPALQGGDRRGG